MKIKNKTAVNFLVDAIGYLTFLVLTGSGVIMAFVLLPGRDRSLGDPTSIMGYGRHDWGDIHFWAAAIFLAAIVVHLLLHWDWLLLTFKRYLNVKTATGVAVAHLIPLLIVLSPVFASRGYEEEEGHGPRSAAVEAKGGQHGSEGRSGSRIWIRGRMTLTDIEEATGVSADAILSALELPSDVPRDLRLGELHQEYEFDMSQLREVVDRLTEPSSQPDE